MNPSLSIVMLLITTESLDQARTISRALLEQRLIACANLLNGVESHYWWKGTLETASEVLIIAKTTASKVEAVREVVRSLHTYEVFELVAVPLNGGNPDYLDWVAQEVEECR